MFTALRVPHLRIPKVLLLSVGLAVAHNSAVDARRQEASIIFIFIVVPSTSTKPLGCLLKKVKKTARNLDLCQYQQKAEI